MNIDEFRKQPIGKVFIWTIKNLPMPKHNACIEVKVSKNCTKIVEIINSSVDIGRIDNYNPANEYNQNLEYLTVAPKQLQKQWRID